MKFRSALLALISAVVAIGWILPIHSDPASDEPAPASTPNTSATPASAVQTVTPALALLRSPAHESSVIKPIVWGPHAEAYFSTDADLKRSFIEAHISSKKVTDVANVLAIIWDCNDQINTSVPVGWDANAHMAQKKLANESQASCREITETYYLRKGELYERVKDRSDYSVDYTGPHGPLLKASYHEVYRLWLSATDPVYLNHLTRDLAVQSVSIKHINGRPITMSEKAASWAGIQLAGCDRGLPCDQRHWLVRLACVAQAKCHDHLQQLLERDGAEFSPWFSGETYFDPSAAQVMKQRFLAGEEVSDL